MHLVPTASPRYAPEHLKKKKKKKLGYCPMNVEAVYLQTAFTPIATSASASKQIHRNFATKIRPVRW